MSARNSSKRIQRAQTVIPFAPYLKKSLLPGFVQRATIVLQMEYVDVALSPVLALFLLSSAKSGRTRPVFPWAMRQSTRETETPTFEGFASMNLAIFA